MKQVEKYTPICEKDYYVGIRDMGQTNKITNKSILAFMENIAGYHACLLHMGYNDISTSHMTWVVLEWNLRVLKRPEYNDRVHLKTWPTHMNRMYIYRDFEMYDEDENLCAIATSKWLLFDVQTGSFVKSPQEHLSKFKFNEKFVFDTKDIPKLKEPKIDPIDVQDFIIRRSDIDLNKHVHNLNYIDFANNVLPEELYFGKDQLNNLEILYKKEIKLGETISLSVFQEDEKYIVVIKDKDSDTIHSVIRLYQ